jgi:hypothetical protein
MREAKRSGIDAAPGAPHLRCRLCWSEAILYDELRGRSRRGERDIESKAHERFRAPLTLLARLAECGWARRRGGRVLVRPLSANRGCTGFGVRAETGWHGRCGRCDGPGPA